MFHNENIQIFESWMRDSNSRPHDYESGALPTELIQQQQPKNNSILNPDSQEKILKIGMIERETRFSDNYLIFYQGYFII